MLSPDQDELTCWRAPTLTLRERTNGRRPGCSRSRTVLLTRPTNSQLTRPPLLPTLFGPTLPGAVKSAGSSQAHWCELEVTVYSLSSLQEMGPRSVEGVGGRHSGLVTHFHMLSTPRSIRLLTPRAHHSRPALEVMSCARRCGKSAETETRLRYNERTTQDPSKFSSKRPDQTSLVAQKGRTRSET